MQHSLGCLIGFFRLFTLPAAIYLLWLATYKEVDMALHKNVMILIGLSALIGWIGGTLLTRIAFSTPSCDVCGKCLDEEEEEDISDSSVCSAAT